MKNVCVKIEELVQVVAAGPANIDDAVRHMFVNSKAYFNLGAFRPFSEQETYLLVNGIRSYLTIEDPDSVVVQMSDRPPLSGEKVAPHEIARFFSNDFLWDSEYLRPIDSRTNFCAWLVALLIRVRYCRDQNETISLPAIVRLISRAASIFSAEELQIFCSKLESILECYEQYPLEKPSH